MTIKAKRAKALPLLADKASRGQGGFVDRSLPTSLEKTLQDLTIQFGPHLPDWLGSRIGRYRALNEIANSTPPISEEIRLIKAAERYLKETEKRLKILPPAADAKVNSACWQRHGRLFHKGLLTDFLALSSEIGTLLGIAEQELESLPTSAGAKSKGTRDSLLSDVAAYLEEHAVTKITKRKAAEIAASILRSADIETPDDTIEVERLIRRHRREGGNSI